MSQDKKKFLNTDEVDALSQKVWQALSDGKPRPSLKELMERGVSPLEVHYLLERWATLTFYDVFNMQPPGEKTPLELVGASKHFLVYDRGSCLVVGPKDLFSHERTFLDGMKTVEATSDEVFNRNWVVELVGYHAWQRVAWVRLKSLSLQRGQSVEIVNFTPSLQDHKIVQAKTLSVNESLRLD